MLILTRRVNESINIGDNVKVKVLDVSERRVRIGVEAPREITVHREEVYWRINRMLNSDRCDGKGHSEES